MNHVSAAILPHFRNLVEVEPPARDWLGAPDPCYQDHELGGAIGCTAREGFILNRAAVAAKPRNMLEIGSYIGWSTAHLLFGNESNITCVDSFTEDAGRLLPKMNEHVLVRFIENMVRCRIDDRIDLVVDRSPDVLPKIAPRYGWDFVFLDGWHLNGQPTRDVLGLLPHLSDDAVLWLHDLWMPDVHAAGVVLAQRGWYFTGFITPNRLSCYWKNEPAWWVTFLSEIV